MKFHKDTERVAAYLLGKRAYDDARQVYECCLSRAKQKDPDAEMMLAVMEALGIGCCVCRRMAVHRLSRLVDQGYIYAILMRETIRGISGKPLANVSQELAIQRIKSRQRFLQTLNGLTPLRHRAAA